MKHNAAARSLRAVAFPVLLLVTVLAAGCNSVSPAKGWAAPLLDGDTLYAQISNGRIGALRLAGTNATELWRYPASGDKTKLTAIYATPVLADGTLYVAAYRGVVVALDARTGALKQGWPAPVDLKQQIVASPALVGRTLYVATEHGTVYALDAATGAQREFASVGSDDRIWSEPQADGERLYVASMDSGLVALDRNSGAVQWRRDLGAIAGAPAIDGSTLLAGSFDHRLYALDLSAQGATRWALTGDAWFWGRPLVTRDTVYAVTVQGTAYATDYATGAERWHANLASDRARSAPVLAGGVLIVATGKGDLFGLDPTSGATLWHTQQEAHFLADPLVLESGVVFLDDSGALWLVAPAGGGVQRIAIVKPN